ncbi:MAG TPA: tetratricopeptide repeat protein [Myxococcota bacterium]
MPTDTTPSPKTPPPAAPEGAADGPAGFTLDTTGSSAAGAVAKLKDNVEYWVSRGRYNKVRIKRNGKAVLPDIPVGALFAVEAATFFWTGLLRAALVNVVGRAFFEVEMISDAEDHYKKGLELFLAGDLKDAEVLFGKALDVDNRFVRAHLQMGVLRKMQGRPDDATDHFEKVLALDPRSDAGKEAAVHLKKLREKQQQDAAKKPA